MSPTDPTSPLPSHPLDTSAPIAAARVPSPHRRIAAIAALVLAVATMLVTRPAIGGAVPAATPVPGAEWTVSSPAAADMSAARLEEARAYAFAEGRYTQGVVVVRGGVIVDEWYAPGKSADSYGASWSMAKSVTSALIGIAIDEGLIPSVDEPMTTYYPEWIGTPRETMTLRQVLHMESGLEWNEDYDASNLLNSDVIQMGLSADELTYARTRPYEVEPGTRWAYSSGDSMLLSGVLSQATGMSVGDYAQAKLFAPIGMDPVDWWVDAMGNTLTYCCVDASSRNFARFGLLYLNDGNWGGTQVVPESWVADSLDFTALSGGRYGYQWWSGSIAGVDEDVFMANGHDGQFIYVVPALDLVVVRNGDYGKSEGPPIADPSLFAHYLANGLGTPKGTTPPDSWSHAAFLTPIIESIAAGADPVPPTTAAPSAPSDPPAPPAAPVAGDPRYTG